MILFLSKINSCWLQMPNKCVNIILNCVLFFVLHGVTGSMETVQKTIQRLQWISPGAALLKTYIGEAPSHLLSQEMASRVLGDIPQSGMIHTQATMVKRIDPTVCVWLNLSAKFFFACVVLYSAGVM